LVFAEVGRVSAAFVIVVQRQFNQMMGVDLGSIPEEV
jgi:hypothetical protein